MGTGAHTIGASYGTDSTHNGSTDLAVQKATATVDITWATPQTYNSSTHPATATVNGGGGDINLSPAATLEYFSGSTAGAAGTGTTTAPTNAGTYTVRASFAGNGNYGLASIAATACEQERHATAAASECSFSINWKPHGRPESRASLSVFLGAAWRSDRSRGP